MRFGPRDVRPDTAATSPAERIREQAARWSDALRQDPDDARLRDAFLRWREADSAHAAAFDRLDTAYTTVLAAAPSRELLAMRRHSLLRVAGHRARRARRRRVVGLAVAATLLLTMFTAIQIGGDWHPGAVHERLRYALVGDSLYRTAVGERLSVGLTDGSRLTLNTDTRAVVQYRDGQRAVRLLRGQAMFEVATDPSRPFVVHAGGRRITALGTAFDVRLSERRFEVTLVEGSITVERDDAASSSAPVQTVARLEPGERFVAGEAAAQPAIEPADVRRVISWRDGQVIFENDPLDRAAREMNRYGGPRIVLADDPALAGLRISGAFNTGNTAGFVATLTSYFDVRVVEADARRIVLARRSTAEPHPG